MGKEIIEQYDNNQKYYQIIFENLPNLILYLDENGIIINCNNIIEDVLGYNKDDIINQPMSKIIHPDYLDIATESFNEILSTGFANKKKYKMICKNDKIIDVNINFSGIKNSSNEYYRTLCIIEDITEKKKAVDSLMESEKKYRYVIDNANIGIVVIQDGNRVFHNSKMREILGYSEEEYQNIDYLSTIFPEDRNLSISRIKDRLKDKKQKPDHIELRLIKKSGEIIWIQTTSKVIEWNGKRAIQAFIIDITEKKKIEATFIKEKLKAERFLNLAGTMLISLNRVGNITLVNKKGYEILGYKKGDLIGKNWFDTCLPKDVKDEIKSVFKKLMQGNVKPVEHYVNPIIRKDGVKRLISWYNTILTDDNGIIIGLLSSGEDITNKKIAEEKLKKSEKKYRLLIENIADWVWSVDKNGIYIYVSPQVKKLMGYSINEILGKTPFDFMDINEAKRVGSIFKNITLKQKKIKNLIDTMITKKGNKIIFETNGSPQYDNNGNFIGYSGICRDVTRKIQYEIALKASEEKFKFIAENLKEGLWITDKNDIMVYINKFMEDISGVKRKEVLGLNVLKDFSQETIQYFKDYYLKTKKTLKTTQYEAEVMTPSGRKTIQAGWLIPKVKDGEYDGIVCTIEDLTEKKKAEKELNESEEKYKSLFETAPCFITTVDKDFNILDINYTVPGLHKNKVVGSKIFDFVDPMFHNKLRRKVKNVFKTGQKDRFESKAIGPNNTISWYDNRIGPIIKNNEFTAVSIIGNDITDRKRREKEIQRQFLKYDIEDGNCYINVERTNIKAVRAFKDLLKTGIDGIIISRGIEKDFLKQIDNHFQFLWMTERHTKNSIHPKKIAEYVEKLQQPYVIFIDRIDYIIHKIGFKLALSLIQNLNDICYMKNHIIILSIDPDTIEKNELLLIKKETHDLEPKNKIQLDDDLIDFLKYIFNKNISGIKPIYSDLGKKFKVSQPTIRRKIIFLKENGYLIEHKRGNKKVLDISEKTRNLFS